MPPAVLQESRHGSGEYEEQQDDEDGCEDFHASMLLLSETKKKWQKCPKS